MALAPINAVCFHCKSHFTDIPKRSFLGFQKLSCPKCKVNVIYPLTSGYRTTYWVLLVFMLLSIAGSFSRGEIGVPGGIGIAVVIALIRDWSIKKKSLVQNAESKLQQELPSLILAAAVGNDELVTSILNSGIEPNITGPNGQTALMLAARNGHFSTVKLLVGRGASLAAVTKAGNSAEDFAVKFEHAQITDYFRQQAPVSGK